MYASSLVIGRMITNKGISGRMSWFYKKHIYLEMLLIIINYIITYFFLILITCPSKALEGTGRPIKIKN